MYEMNTQIMYGAQSAYDSSSSGANSYQTNMPSYQASGNYQSSNFHEYFARGEHAENITEIFLEEERPITPVVANKHEIMPVIEQTFELITGQEFPADSIQITICDAQMLKIIHEQTGRAWNNGIMGFSINRYGKGISEVYAREEHLDALLLTIGHEIGHILSPSLPNKKDEEAKAHAFSIAWMETIRDNNICGLKPNIKLNPAKNGLHDTAYEFVQHLMITGASAFDVFKTLAHGLTSIIAR